MRTLVALLVCLLAPAARADDGEDVAEETDESADGGYYEEAPDLEARMAELEERLQKMEADTARLQQELEAKNALQVRFFGALDVGFFWVGGNGSGVRKDYARAVRGTDDILATWVFVGDPLSTTINARGDVADLGDSRALHVDPIHSQGKPTFLVNAVSLGFSGFVGDEVSMSTLVDFLPRDALLSGAPVGDFIDVKLAWLRWERALGPVKLAITAGKFDSVHGLEYRTQETATRLTVTPSLLCRYTCGRTIGLRVQGVFLDGALEAAVSLTNGSAQTELFPWSNETDWNGFKTVHGRLLAKPSRLLEFSVSGSVGAQDRQPDDSLLQWHLGAAARFTPGAFLAQVEVVGGRAPGKPEGDIACGAASCLNYLGAYGLFAYKIAYLVTPYLRVDWRQSTMRNARAYAYESNELRATVGLRVEPVKRLLLKAEYTFNHELFGVPFDDDVFTTSVVMWF